jgi:argininosuccinate synthase
MFRMTVSAEDAPDKPEYVEIEYAAGNPVAINGERLDPVSLVRSLNEIGGRNAIGRIDLVENRFVGIKSRGCYETPGGTLLVAAHQELESLCLDRELLHFKQQIALKYAEMVYYGLWFTPLREALDAFVLASQITVTGTVTMRLYKGNVTVAGRTSPYSLYQTGLAAFSMDGYNPKDAEGFIRILGLPARVQAPLRQAAGACAEPGCMVTDAPQREAARA